LAEALKPNKPSHCAAVPVLHALSESSTAEMDSTLVSALSNLSNVQKRALKNGSTDSLSTNSGRKVSLQISKAIFSSFQTSSQHLLLTSFENANYLLQKLKASLIPFVKRAHIVFDN
jgi:hypothetical protein